MLIPIFILFIFSSILWLAAGIKNKNETTLLLLNIFWWLGSLVTAYFTLLVWLDRGYSENWAMIGFMMFSLPYILITGGMVAGELFFIRKWQSDKTKTVKVTSVSLLIFLLLQMFIGFLSA